MFFFGKKIFWEMISKTNAPQNHQFNKYEVILENHNEETSLDERNPKKLKKSELPKKETVVHCFKQDGMYFGRLIWVENLERKGQPLSEPDKHFINYIVLRNFEYKDNEWVNGIIRQPKTNKNNAH